MRGYDLSNWQNGLDVTKTSVDFVIAKATGGTSYVDKTCNTFISQAKQSGKLWGFYHFAKDGHASQDGAAEARFFMQNTKDYWGEGLPVLDLEDNGILDWAKFTKDFVETVYAEKKVWCVIYTGLQGISRLKAVPEVLKNCPVWFAGYPLGYINYWLPETSTPQRYYSIDAAANIIMWQFTSAISEQCFNCDANICYVDKIKWKMLSAGKREEVKERTVWQYTANATDAQRWLPKWNKDGSVTLISKSCGLALDVQGGSKSSGALVQAYPQNGTDAQKWKLVQVKGKYNPQSVAPFELVPVLNSKLRLDVKGGSCAEKVSIQTYTANNTNAQRWVILDDGNGYWTLVNVKSGKVLDVKGGGK